MNMLFNSLKANNRPYMMPLRKWILLVIRWAGVGYGLYLVEELIHGEATGLTVYDVSKTRYNL